jgi:hypothetical protein
MERRDFDGVDEVDNTIDFGTKVGTGLELPTDPEK